MSLFWGNIDTLQQIPILKSLQSTSLSFCQIHSNKSRLRMILHIAVVCFFPMVSKLLICFGSRLSEVFFKKVFLKSLQNSLASTCSRVSFAIKLQASAYNFIKKVTLAQVFSGEFCNY